MTHNAAQVEEPLTPADLTDADIFARKLNTELRRIVEAFTGWNVWHSNQGVLYATRMRDLTENEIKNSLSHTLVGDTWEHLVARIRLEERMAAEVAQTGKASWPPT